MLKSRRQCCKSNITLISLNHRCSTPLSSMNVPFASQSHCHLLWATFSDSVSSIALAHENGIAVTGYSSFGPQSFLELEWKMPGHTPLLFDQNVIKQASAAHRKTPAQILLRWATQRGLAVIPKSNNPERLAQNLDVTSFNLSEEELEGISRLDRGLRFNDPADYLKEPIRLFA